MKKLQFLLLCSLFTVISGSVFTSCSKKKAADPVVIRMFSNLPDRKFGQGGVEQIIIDNYMRENPGIKIEVETLDENAYKTKFKAYCLEELPDIVSIWGQNAFLEDAINANLLMELNEEDYKDYKFIDGTLDGFKKDGKLYGLPRNTDIALFYYNERIFYDYRWKLPKTFEELLEFADEVNSHNVTPIAMDGSDGWPLIMFISDILFSIAGTEYSTIVDNAIQNHDFSNKYIRRALEIFIQCCERGLFQKNFTCDDYGTAQNLFLGGKAAMYYMGSWEASMVVNKTYWDYVTKNIRIITFPPMKGQVKGSDDVLAWHGGGYAISQTTKHKKEVLDFYNYIFKPENLSYIGYRNSVGLSAQDQTAFREENESICIQQLLDLNSRVKHISGTTINDRGSSNFKLEIESNVQKLAVGELSIDDFIMILNRESMY